MRVLVTGHNGYIGTVLTPMLLDAGHDVVGLDSNLFVECTFGAEPAYAIPETVKDVRDVEAADVAGLDAIIHLAGLSNDPLGDLNPELTYEINHRASVRLAELAKQAGVKRFIFSSSCSNYGSAGEEFIDESAPFNPVTPYGESKVMVERDVARLADDDFHPTFLRNSTAFGFSPRLRFDLVLNNLMAWAYTTGLVYLKSDGTPWRPIVHVEDISRAFLAVLEAPLDKVHNAAFNVGRTEDNYQIRELAQIVVDTVPGSRLEFAPGAGPDKRTYRVNCDLIQQTLSAFKPQWDARKGAQQLYEVYQQYDLGADDYEGPRYKRLAHLQKLMDAGRVDQALRWTTT